MKNIYEVLSRLDIEYQKYEHPAVFTVEEASKYDRGDAIHSKNLFLRNKKGDKHYLIVIRSSIKVNIKNLEEKLGEKNLSFASPDRLMKYLGLTPGSVSPFGLINDISKEVNVIVDNGLMLGERQAFHPNINTVTLVLKTSDFKKFLDYTGNNLVYMDL